MLQAASSHVRAPFVLLHGCSAADGRAGACFVRQRRRVLRCEWAGAVSSGRRGVEALGRRAAWGVCGQGLLEGGKRRQRQGAGAGQEWFWWYNIKKAASSDPGLPRAHRAVRRVKLRSLLSLQKDRAGTDRPGTAHCSAATRTGNAGAGQGCGGRPVSGLVDHHHQQPMLRSQCCPPHSSARDIFPRRHTRTSAFDGAAARVSVARRPVRPSRSAQCPPAAPTTTSRGRTRCSYTTAQRGPSPEYNTARCARIIGCAP